MRVFVAAAQRGSFTSAAAQLGIGQPAVSRHIANLERSLSVVLFLRNPSSTRLTQHGQVLFDTAQRCLADLDQVVDDLRSDLHRPRVTVDVSIAFATLWLLARLDKFSAQHPEVDLRLVTREEALNSIPDADVIISFDDPSLVDANAISIVPEHLVVICAKNYDKAAVNLTAADLREHRLLFLDLPMHRGDWSRLLGGEPVTRGESFSSYSVYLQAIIEGRGIGIGWRQLIDPQFESGLVRLASDIDVKTARGYFAVRSGRAGNVQAATDFVDWLASQR
jgi:DNA-binding transcriptional LysR family regulator